MILYYSINLRNRCLQILILAPHLLISEPLLLLLCATAITKHLKMLINGGLVTTRIM